MSKFVVSFIFIMSFVFSNISNAALITDSSLLTSEHYVTYEGEGLTIDFAWASPVNVEFWGDPNLETTNRLYAPELHEGWGYASDSDLDILLANFTLDDFSNGDGTYIQAVSFWNSVRDDIVLRLNIGGVEVVFNGNLLDYTPGKVSSEWVSSGVDGSEVDGSGNESFYVRKNITSVPEPTTLLIFSMAILALASRKKLFN